MSPDAYRPLGALTEKVSNWNPSSLKKPIPITYVDIASIDQTLKEITAPQSIRSNEAPSRARQLVQTGDVLVSTVRPNLNAVAAIENGLGGATASTGFAVLRPKQGVLDYRYLFHWVKAEPFIRFLTSRATGASYPAVTDAIVREAVIPWFPVDEQRRIAAILDKADAIRRKHEQALALADDFLRSTFLHMFGDPRTKSRPETYSSLGELGAIRTGKTPPTIDKANFGDDVWFVTPSDLGGRIREASRSISRLGAAKSVVVPAGS